jgi:hypothetical protein
MLTHLTRAQLLRLAEPSSEPCLSVYLPVDELGGRSAAKRLRQNLHELEGHLGARNLTSAASDQMVSAVLAEADELEHHTNDRSPLVVLAQADRLVAERLPYAVPERFIWGRQLHLKPLLPLVTQPTTYVLLALGKAHVQLYRGSGVSLEPLALPGAPAGLEGLLQDTTFEPQHQLHSGVPGRGGERGAIFHGQGDAADHLKPQLLRYCQQVDRAVREAIADQSEPLVLCGVGYLLAIYRTVSHYPTLIAEAIVGSPEHLSPAELGERASALMGPYAEQRQRAALERLTAPGARSTAPTCTGVRQLLPAAAAGLVDTAFVAIDQEQWGGYDQQTGHILLHAERQPGDEDLLNLIVIETLRHSGSAYAVPADALPGGGLCVALLRHAAPTAAAASAEPWR